MDYPIFANDKQKTMGNFRKIIRTKRKELGFTQAQLARVIDVRPSTISDYETGKAELGADKIEKIFKLLKIKIDLK